ncbi:MAG: hypothetical protein EOO50_13605 [Flavobacterium sp.]|uniref:hypothetical protein n=1 Tax=Flavobacterium sp. TaxID=239 RepID=UPI0011F96D18|nr:hypothetical protein [Flavobacterium sp.]RZJ65494.1 MAG: hypothetical protein EOO50_13605 [Flavobacterium sp.]
MRTAIALLSILLLGCDHDFEGGTRFVTEVTVAQQNGAPVQDVEVNLRSDFNGGSLISFDDTDSEGNVEFVFPKSKGGNYSISIDETDVYLPMKFTDFQNADFVNYTYSINPLVLYRKDEATILQIVPNRVSDANLLSVRATVGTVPTVIDLHPDEENLPDGDYFFKTRYDVFQNVTVEIHYLVEENGVITELTTNAVVGTEPVTFSLSY